MIPVAEFVKALPGRNSSATHELVFLASRLPPIGSKSYYIEVVNKSEFTGIKNQTDEKSVRNEVF